MVYKLKVFTLQFKNFVLSLVIIQVFFTCSKNSRDSYEKTILIFIHQQDQLHLLFLECRDAGHVPR